MKNESELGEGGTGERDVRCFFCDRQMYYYQHPLHVPEVHISVDGDPHPLMGFPDGFSAYAHTGCFTEFALERIEKRRAQPESSSSASSEKMVCSKDVFAAIGAVLASYRGQRPLAADIGLAIYRQLKTVPEFPATPTPIGYDPATIEACALAAERYHATTEYGAVVPGRIAAVIRALATDSKGGKMIHSHHCPDCNQSKECPQVTHCRRSEVAPCVDHVFLEWHRKQHESGLTCSNCAQAKEVARALAPKEEDHGKS